MKILVVLGDGGHTKQILTLIKLLGDKHEYVYLAGKSDQTSAGKIPYSGQIYRADPPSSKKKVGILQRFTRLVRSTVQEFVVVVRVRPQVILSMGASIAVPISLVGRLMGVKIIHVESASRIYALSTTGKIMYRVAHLFFVQWERHLADYPRAIYAGRLL